MVERFNGRIEDVLQSHHFRSGEDLEQTILRYVRLYNGQLPQSVLNGRTPIDALKHWHRQKPELFKKRSYNHAGCDNHVQIAKGMRRSMPVIVGGVVDHAGLGEAHHRWCYIDVIAGCRASGVAPKRAEGLTVGVHQDEIFSIIDALALVQHPRIRGFTPGVRRPRPTQLFRKAAQAGLRHLTGAVGHDVRALGILALRPIQPLSQIGQGVRPRCGLCCGAVKQIVLRVEQRAGVALIAARAARPALLLARGDLGAVALRRPAAPALRRAEQIARGVVAPVPLLQAGKTFVQPFSPLS